MELNVKEAFNGLTRMESTEEILNVLRTEWETEKARPFNPTQNARQIAVLLLVSPTLRNIAGYSDRLAAFDGFTEEIRLALEAKLKRNPYGASLAASIGNYCHPVKKGEEEPIDPVADRMWRRLDGQTTPF